MAEAVLFARPVRVDAIPRGGLERTIEASEAERAALAKFDGLAAIGRLTASFVLLRGGGDVVRVRGEVHAEVTQTCVVSLEPFDVILDEAVDVRFAPPASESLEGRAVEPESLATGDQEAPDPLIDGRIDLGALAAEFLILGLDPYPRKPGVEFAGAAKREPADAPATGADGDSPTGR